MEKNIARYDIVKFTNKIRTQYNFYRRFNYLVQKLEQISQHFTLAEQNELIEALNKEDITTCELLLNCKLVELGKQKIRYINTRHRLVLTSAKDSPIAQVRNENSGDSGDKK